MTLDIVQALVKAVDATAALKNLHDDLIAKVEWRRSMRRQSDAADLVERLADEIRQMPRSSALPEDVARFCRLYNRDVLIEDISLPGVEIDAYLTAIGIRHFPEDATALLSDLLLILEAWEAVEAA